MTESENDYFINFSSYFFPSHLKYRMNGFLEINIIETKQTLNFLDTINNKKKVSLKSHKESAVSSLSSPENYK